MYITTTTINIPTVLEDIFKELTNIGIRPILVGGCVRDNLLNLPIKDYDIELYGLDSLDNIETSLKKFGTVKQVGKSFGVLILSVESYDFDFALPRTEKKIGNSHSDFEIKSDGGLSFEEAAKRRDFTINAIGYDYLSKEYLDPFNGIEDLKKKKLRHIKDESFVEDPLRVYRAIQFTARFDFKLDGKTFNLCKQMVEDNLLEFLAKERIYEEFKKLFLNSLKPSLGFELMKKLDVLKYFPELKSLIACEQDEEYHPEGDVWVHTLMTIDVLAKILREENIQDDYRKLYLFYGILCHDLGKPLCTKEINGRITSYKHESLGIEPTISFLSKITNEKKFIDIVCTLVKNHLTPFQLYLNDSSQKAIKRLSLKVNIEDLYFVCLADCLGRDIKDKEKCHKFIEWLLEKAKELNIKNEPIKPLIMGKDLIGLGLNPSKEFKKLLNLAFDLQIDCNYSKDEILVIIKNRIIS
jgi:tRNA nucleotidyltransferase (CCA-adding enzyme)